MDKLNNIQNINKNEQSCSIDSLAKLKLLIQLFSFLISKDVQNLHFIKEENCLSYYPVGKIFSLKINDKFFKTININKNTGFNFPILNLINDLKLCKKNKKNFPNIYFKSTDKTFYISSIYQNSITTDIKVPNLQNNDKENIFVTKSNFDNINYKCIQFFVKTDILSKLICNNVLIDTFKIIISDKIIFKFEQTNSIVKDLTIDEEFENDFELIVSTNFVKDIIKYFPNENIKFNIYPDEKKMICEILFKDEDNIELKLIYSF